MRASTVRAGDRITTPGGLDIVVREVRREQQPGLNEGDDPVDVYAVYGEATADGTAVTTYLELQAAVKASRPRAASKRASKS
jgi:hypothetical protein